MEMNEIFDKLQAVADRYDELNELISDPSVIADTKRFMKLSKEEGSLRETVEKYHEYQKVTIHDLVQLVQGQTNSMVGNPILRVVIGPNPF